MHFAAWVRETRVQKKLSGTECAERAGVSQAAWSEWEQAGPEKEWRKPTVHKIADALEVPRKLALTMAGRVSSDAPDEIIGLRLGPIVAKAPPNRRESIIDALEEIAQRMVSMPG